MYLKHNKIFNRCITVGVAFGFALYSSWSSAEFDLDQLVEHTVIQDNLREIEQQKKAGLPMLNGDLAGDRISISNGSLEIYHNYVSVPGNSSIPVQYARYRKDKRGWVEDVPQIRARVVTSYGIQGDPRPVFPDDPRLAQGEYWDIKRCSGRFYPGSVRFRSSNSIPHPDSGDEDGPLLPRVSFDVLQLFLPADEYYQGLALDYEGGRTQSLMKYLPSIAEEFKSGFRPSHITTENWKVQCIDDIGDQDGDGKTEGEGFLAVTPDGTRYRFDKLFYRNPALMHYTERTDVEEVSHLGQYVSRIPYNDALMKVSEITDVHGNWVKYEYDNKGNLLRIHSNDRRNITITRIENPDPSSIWTAFGQKTPNTVTVNGRTWDFSQEDKVILPDGTDWELIRNLPSDAIPEDVCEQYERSGGWFESIKHPNGARVTFQYSPHITLYSGNYTNLLGYPWLPCEADTQLRDRDTGQFFSRSLKGLGTASYIVSAKTVELPDGTTYRWTYEHEPMPPKPDNSRLVLNRSKWVKVTAPDGSRKTYWVNRTRSERHGRIEKVETFNPDSTTPVETVTSHYETGHKNGQTGIIGFNINHYVQFVTKREIEREGETYTTEYDYVKDPSASNYSFAQPTGLREYSSLNPTLQRTATIDYRYLKEKWVLNLPEKVTRNDKEFERFVFNDQGQVKDFYRFGVRRDRYTYHSDGQLATSTNALGQSTAFDHYYRGQARRITRADGSQFFLTIDPNGWVTRQTDWKGNPTSYQYNALGWLKKIIYPPDGTVVPGGRFADTNIDYRYNSKGVQETVSNGAEQTVTQYDGFFRPVSVIRQDLIGNGQASLVQTQYDAYNRPVFRSYPSDNINAPTLNKGIATKYDALGRVTKVSDTTDPDNLVTTYLYIDDSIHVIDPDNVTTVTRFEAFGHPDNRQTVSVRPLNTVMKYDIWGNLLNVRQGGFSHQYYYDNQFRLCRQSIPETGDKLLQYDAANQLRFYSEGQDAAVLSLDVLTMRASSDSRYYNNGHWQVACTEPDDDNIELVYDTLGQNTQVLYSDDTPDVTRVFDDNGNLTQLDRGDSRWGYSYNATNQIFAEVLAPQTGQSSLNFAIFDYRNQFGHRTKIASAGNVITFDPNGFGQPTELKNHNDSVYARDIRYYATGDIKSFTYGNGAQFSQALNERRLLAAKSVRFPGARPNPIDLSYRYTHGGDISSISDHRRPEHSIQLKHDDLKRLKYAKGSWGETTFNYDRANNLDEKYTLRPDGTTTAVNLGFDRNNNRLASSFVEANSFSRRYFHDKRGNVISDGLNGFTYDLSNQPIQYIRGFVGTNYYAYDGNFKRYKQTLFSGETIYSMYSRADGLAMRYNQTDNIFTHYIFLQGMPIARLERSNTPPDVSRKTTYIHTDHLGSPVAATDSAGNILWEERYTPFGVGINQPEGTQKNMGFTGHINDDSTGLVYMQARYYDLVIGRFLSNDPVDFLGHLERGSTQGFNRYAYAYNNPYKYTDPDGELPIVPIIIAGARACASNAACRGAVVKASRKVANTIKRGRRKTKHTDNRHVDRKKFSEKSKFKKPNQMDKISEKTVKKPDRVQDQGDRVRVEKDFKREIGTKGEKTNVTVVDKKTGKRVTQFPKKQDE